MKRTNRVLIFSAIAVISMGCGMVLKKDKTSPTPENPGVPGRSLVSGGLEELSVLRTGSWPHPVPKQTNARQRSHN